MATFKKLPSGKWQAQVARQGIRKSKTFPTKAAARDWATRQEFLIENAGPEARESFGDVLDRYAREVSPDKRGARWEILRLERFKADPIAKIKIARLSAADLAEWRDGRLREVSPGTVRREMGLLGAVLTQARREWGLIKESPLRDVRKPSSPPPRDRRVAPGELAKLIEAAGEDLTKAQARAVHAFRFAIETAMRAGEICGLTWDCVDLVGQVVQLPMTKNGRARAVPLSRAAVDLLEALPGRDGPCFQIDGRSLDVLFRRSRDAARIENLTFHDSRHEAITRLARKLDVLDLARMVGHTDLKNLMIYYNATAEELAARLG